VRPALSEGPAMPFDCLSFAVSIKFFERAILTDDAPGSQGFSMFFSRLGEPQRLHDALGVRLAKADDFTVCAVKRKQPRFQSADFQRLAFAQARFGGRVELGTRQPFEQ